MDNFVYVLVVFIYTLSERERPGRVNFITLGTHTDARSHTTHMKLKLKCAQTRKTLLTRSYAIYDDKNAKRTKQN